ncbi:LytTR family DNA-binding domain-containing protein [Blautia schinkii]|nr:LytTR family DNA-binding domain-containing protein [Blautia schinkii]
MYHLIFCDDDEAQVKQVSARVVDYCRKKKEYETEAVLCTDERALFKALQDAPEEKVIVFLDICMRDQQDGGIRLARKINKRYPHALVVYITGYLQFVSDVYETEHCYFILKDELEERLPVLFEKIIPALIKPKEEWLNLYVGSKMHRIAQHDILYLERDLRKTKINLRNGDILVTGEKLDELFEQLNTDYFIRSHNSFIVNLNYVREVNRQYLVLSNGAVVNVSRSYAAEVRRRFTLWGNRKF